MNASLGVKANSEMLPMGGMASTQTSHVIKFLLSAKSSIPQPLHTVAKHSHSTEVHNRTNFLGKTPPSQGAKQDAEERA